MSKLRKSLLISLTALFVLTVAIFGMLKLTAARAADVLDGNSATYSFVNDPTNPWIYERDTNTWSNTTDNTATRKLTLNITSPGNVKFKYLANLNNTNKQGSTQNGFNASDFYITLNKGEYHNNIVVMHGEKMSDYKELSIEGLQTGDSIIFTYKLASGNVDSDKVLIKGLNSLPVENKSVNLSVMTGGQIDFNGLKDSVDENIANGSLLKFKAVANEGYDFAFWQNEKGEVVSTNAEMSLILINDIKYTAYFTQKDKGEDFFGDEKWQLDGSTWKLNTADVPANEIHRLKYVFKDTKNVEFSYDYRSNDYDSLIIYLDGNYNSYIDKIYDFDDEGVIDSERYEVSGDGYHVLEFVYLNDQKNSPTNKLELSNFKNVAPEMAKEGLTAIIHYNPKLGRVYINGVYVTPDIGFTVPKDEKVSFKAEEFSQVDSTIRPGETTTVRWAGYHAHDENNVIKARNANDKGEIWPDRTTSSIQFNSDGTTTYGSAFKMTGYEIDVRFWEVALAPEVSVVTQSGSDISEEISIHNNDFIDLVYEKENNVQLLFKAPEGIEPNYKIKVNDSLVEDPKLVTEAGKTVYSISDVNADKTVTICYGLAGYFDSPEITVNFKINSEYSVEDKLILNKDKISMHNDQYYPWEFSAEYTSDMGYAYMPVNVGAQGFYGKTVSSLKFDLKNIDATGIFVFDFMLHAGSNILTYSFDRPLTINDSISRSDDDLQDNNGEYVYLINGDSQSYKYILGRGSDDDKDISNRQKYYWFTEPYIGDKTMALQDDNWVHVSIPVSSENSQIYINYFKSSDHYGNAIPYNSSNDPDYVLIRNVGCFSGEGKIKYSVSNPSAGQISVTEYGNDKSINSGDTLPLGSRVTFNATVNPDLRFYAWVDADTNEILSFDKTFIATVVKNDFNVKAVIDDKDKFVARVKGVYYEDFEQAVSNAQNQSVIVISDFTIKNSLTINSDTTVIMPVNDRGDWYELGTDKNSSTRVSWSEANSEKNYLLNTLTIENDAVLTIRGNFYIGAVLNHPNQYAQGLTSGNYNKLVLNGNIVVEEGGMLDVMGLVTGDGGITVNKGGKLYQPFMILDYSGGTNTQAMFGEGVTPFKMYAMVNIQCKNGYTIKYGGALYGHASLYFWKGTNTIDQPFITYKEGKDELATALIILDSEDSYVHTVYDDKDYDTTENGQHKRVEMEAGNNTQDVGFTKMEIVGDASAGYMSFPLGINTAGVNFSLPYNYSLNIKSGTFTVANHFKLMPGSSVKVESEAKVVVAEGKSLQVYDSFYGPSVAKRAYPTGAQLIAAGYKPYADFVVNGTLELKEGATFVGTVQNEGTGTIIVGDNVKLSAELFDGVATQYTCNYTKYTLNAQIWDAAHGEMRTPEAGKTYKAASEVATFNLPGIKFEYETNTGASGDHSHKSGLAELTTEQASGLKGAWVVEHAGHQYEWNYTDEEYPTDGERVKTVTRQCTQTGCNDMGEHHLLYTETALNLGDITFKNSAVTESDIRTLLTAYYGEEIETLIQSIAIDGEKINHGQNYAVTVTLTDGAYFYADGETKESFTFNYNIKEADLTDVTLSRAEKTYDGTAITEEIISKVVAGGLEVNAEDYDVNIALKSGGANSANAGVYTVTVTGKNNFKGTVSKDFTINRVQITVNVKKNLTATYAGIRTAPAIPAEAYEMTGTPVGSDRVQVTVRYNSSVNTWKAGNSFALTADVKITNGNAANYNITVHEGSITLTKKAVSLKIGNKTSVYGKTPDKNWEVEGVEGFAGDFDETTILGMLNVTCEVTKDSTAGDYAINAQWKPGRDAFENFDVTLQGGTYTVSPAEYADVTFEGETEVTYDGNEHYLTINAPEGAEVTITYKLRDGEEEYSDKKPVAAGTYDVKAVITSQNYNSGEPYTINGTLEITPAQIASVTVSGSYTYDGTAKELEVTVTTENGLTLTQDDYTVQCENFVNAQEDIEYTVTAKGNNYAGSQSTTFTIAKKAVTVKIEDQSKVYDANDPSLAQTFEIEGLVESQDIGLRLKLASGGKDAGEYRITYEVTAEAVANNYKITYCTYDGRAITDVNYPKYTVTPAQATITVNDLTSEYGDEVKTNYTFESEGFLPDGYTPQLNYQCEVEQGDNVGAYDITATVENSNDNYTIKVNKGRYEVTKRHIKITVNDGESVYGEAIPEEYAGYTLSEGDKYGNDDLHITYIKYAAGTDAKTYTIGAKCGNKNYDAEIVEGKWTITKKPVTGIMVIVSDGTTDYTDTEGNGVIHVKYVGKTLTVRAGAPQPYDELRVTTTVTQINGAGTYQVTAKIVDANYSGETTVTIEAAPDLNSTLALLESLKAQLSGEELTADDFAVLKQMNELISALDENDRDSAELDEYKELIASWNEAANVDEAAVEQVNDLADDVLAGLIATLSAAAALAYVVMVGGKAV